MSWLSSAVGGLTGGFLNTDKSSSSSSSSQVTTNTTTQLRDIGLTGDAAVALAGTLAGATVNIAQIGADVLKTEAQQQGEGFKQLIGGASEVIRSARDQSSSVLSSATDQANLIVQSAQATAARLTGNFDPQTLWTIAGVLFAGIAVLIMVKR